MTKYHEKPVAIEAEQLGGSVETFQDRVRKELYFGMGCDGYKDLAFAGMWVSRRLSNSDLEPTYCVMQDHAEPMTDELRHKVAWALRQLADNVEGVGNWDVSATAQAFTLDNLAEG
jgi:hypothetical protein